MSNKDLAGKVAVVAGATRGAGRAIATALGERGATVYCTGRSTKSTPGSRPETLEETAALVDAAGGKGVVVRADHTVEADVVALADKVKAEAGGVDVLVNDIWGGEKLMEFGTPFWKCSIEKGRTMLERAVLSHMITARHIVPLMLDRPRAKGSALVVEVTDGDSFGWRGMFFYDVVKMSVIRLAFAMSRELVDTNVTALAVTPGYLRSEEMLETFGVREENWRDAVKDHPDFAAAESPAFVGRCIAALAADPDVKQKAGRVYASWNLAKEYGVVDVDGSVPDWGAHFEKTYGPIAAADYTSWEDGPMEAVARTMKKKASADG